MRCKKAKKLISDYIDGELNSSKSSSLEEHLKECEECRKTLESYETITQAAQEFNAGSPSPFVWTRIKQELKTSVPSYGASGKGKRMWSWTPQLKYAVGLLSVFVVIGAAVIGIYRLGNQGQTNHLDPQDKVIANLKEAERHYKLAIESMRKAVDAQDNGMAPEVAEVFQTNLELIDSSIAACREAVLNDPKDIESRNILLAAYKEKANLLYKLLTVKEISPRRGESETKI